MSDAILCGPESVGYGECWNCADTVPEHVTDRRFCSHECALEWTDAVGVAR